MQMFVVNVIKILNMNLNIKRERESRDHKEKELLKNVFLSAAMGNRGSSKPCRFALVESCQTPQAFSHLP